MLRMFGAVLIGAVATHPAAAPPGRWIDLGAHRLHFHCTGHGSPTVVVETGFDEFGSDWTLVQRAVAPATRICTYDRAGYGRSEPGPFPRTFAQIGLELHDALAKAGEKPPFVLVGHSFGGGVVRQYALDHPADVAGMVLVDIVSENQRIPMGDRVALIADDARGRPIPAPQADAPRPTQGGPGGAGAPTSTVPATVVPAAPIEPPYDRLPLDAQRSRTWALAQPERNPRREKAVHAADQRMANRSQTPGRDRERVANFRPEAVDEPTEAEQADRVGRLEGRVDLAKLGVGPMQLVVQNGLEQREDLAIDVVDRRGEEEQRANQPAVPAHARLFTRFSRNFGCR